MHACRGHAARLCYVVGDALNLHAPTYAASLVPAIDLETDLRAGCEVQFGAGGCSEEDDALVEEVVDREYERAHISVDQGDPAKVMRFEQLDALLISQDL